MWFTLSLLAGLLFALNKLIVRGSLSKDTNPLAFGAFHELLAGVLLLPIALFHIAWPQSIETWIVLVIGVLFIFLTDLTAFFSLKYTEASLYQIVGQLRHVIVLFGALLLFSEPII